MVRCSLNTTVMKTTCAPQLLYHLLLLVSYGSAAGLDTCFFTSYSLARSTMCGSISSLQIGVSQPKSVDTSPTETRLLFSRREKNNPPPPARRNSATLLKKGEKQPWMISPLIHWLGSLFFLVYIELIFLSHSFQFLSLVNLCRYTSTNK